MIIDEIKKMTTRQRIHMMEQIWDTLLDEDNTPESPQWHNKILENRKKKIESGKAKFLSIDELKRLKSA